MVEEASIFDRLKTSIKRVLTIAPSNQVQPNPPEAKNEGVLLAAAIGGEMDQEQIILSRSQTIKEEEEEVEAILEHGSMMGSQ